MNVIARLHAEWEARTVPRNASPIKREEMKRSFYSGFIACMIHHLNGIAAIEDDDEACRQIDAIREEGEDYFRNLGKGPPDRFAR